MLSNIYYEHTCVGIAELALALGGMALRGQWEKTHYWAFRKLLLIIQTSLSLTSTSLRMQKLLYIMTLTSNWMWEINRLDWESQCSHTPSFQGECSIPFVFNSFCRLTLFTTSTRVEGIPLLCFLLQVDSLAHIEHGFWYTWQIITLLWITMWEEAIRLSQSCNFFWHQQGRIWKPLGNQITQSAKLSMLCSQEISFIIDGYSEGRLHTSAMANILWSWSLLLHYYNWNVIMALQLRYASQGTAADSLCIIKNSVCHQRACEERIWCAARISHMPWLADHHMLLSWRINRDWTRE